MGSSIPTTTTIQTSFQSSVMLQAYNWDSWRNQNKNFFKYLGSKSELIKQCGIDAVWLPPCTKSVSPQGYMPLDLYDLNSEYGTKEELKQCIDVFKKEDINVFGDMVINHRCAEFQNQDGIYNVFGGKLAWDDTAIVANDTKFQGTGNPSPFKLFHAAPNIDHSQPFVQKDVSEWMRWMKEDIGFDGFRFDFMTGVDPEHMKQYISIPDISIGEYWDDMAYDHEYLQYNQDAHRQRIVDWLDRSGKCAHAFDTTTKGVLQTALENKEYWRLSDPSGNPPGVMGWWKERSVTFLDNHDTHINAQNLWPFPQNHLVEGYTYILTHPGVPMIYWDDLFIKGLNEIIVLLIQVRKAYDIHAGSDVNIIVADDQRYTAVIDGKIEVTIGNHTLAPNQNILFRSHNVLIAEPPASVPINSGPDPELPQTDDIVKDTVLNANNNIEQLN